MLVLSFFKTVMIYCNGYYFFIILLTAFCINFSSTIPACLTFLVNEGLYKSQSWAVI